MNNKVKRHKDDLGSTIDAEDNLTKMILIEQAIDAANKINETVSRSYAYYDCLTAILDFARESNNEAILNRADSILAEIQNKGAHARALSYLAVVLSALNYEEEAEKALLDAIKYASEKTILRGKVLNWKEKEPLQKTKITILETEQFTYTDEEGKFEFTDLDLSFPLTLQAKSENGFTKVFQINDYAQEYKIGYSIKGKVFDKERIRDFFR